MDSLNQQPTLAKPHTRVGFFVLLAAFIVSLGVIGWFGWMYLTWNTERLNLQNQKQDLQSQIEVLKKQQASAPASAPSDLPCSPTISATFKENIAAAVESHNYSALAPSMASTVRVILAASEGVGDRTPDQAVSDMAYLTQGTAPWNFALPAATIAVWDAGFYTGYFDDNTYVGRAANGMVVVFDFNECAKINEVFIVPNEELLL